MLSKIPATFLAVSLAALASSCGDSSAQDHVVAKDGALIFPFPEDPCFTALCPAGTHCEHENVQCFAGPCPPIPVCVPDPAPLPTPPACGAVCQVFCEFGNVLDEKGCPTCFCNPPPKPADPCATVRCAAGTHCEVENVQCFAEPCPPSTVCVPDKPPVPESPRCGPGPVCDVFCEFGHRLDDQGCVTCACNPPPKPVCEGGCGLYCEFGNVVDENGCPICKCNPPPRGLFDDT
jgi:hypothetical protein